MSQTVLVALVGTLTAAITAAVGYLGTRGANRNASLSGAAAEWRTLYEALDEKLTQQQAQITDSQRRITALERSQARLMDYAQLLRTHIERELGPPAPPWPTGIIDTSD